MIQSINWADKLLQKDRKLRELFLSFYQQSMMFRTSLTLTNIESVYNWTESLDELKEYLWENHIGS